MPGPRDVVRLRTSSSHWNDPGKGGPHSELFFFLIRKEPVAVAAQQALTGTATLCRGLKCEGTSSSECEHNVESLAPSVMRQDQSGEKNSLFLEGACEGGCELPLCPGLVVPGQT